MKDLGAVTFWAINFVKHKRTNKRTNKQTNRLVGITGDGGVASPRAGAHATRCGQEAGTA
jgi:hypothetical protein